MKLKNIFLIFIIFTGCWGYKTDGYMLFSNYKKNNPLIIDLQTGARNSIQRFYKLHKEYPYLQSFRVYPDIDEVHFLWSECSSCSKTIIETYSLSTKTLLKQLNFNGVDNIDQKDGILYYSTGESLYSYDGQSSKIIYQTINERYKKYIRMFAICDNYIAIKNSNNELILIDLAGNKKFQENNVEYIQYHDGFLYYARNLNVLQHNSSKDFVHGIVALNLTDLSKQNIVIPIKKGAEAFCRLSDSIYFHSLEKDLPILYELFGLMTLYTKGGIHLEFGITDIKENKTKSLFGPYKVYDWPPKLQYIPNNKSLKNILTCY